MTEVFQKMNRFSRDRLPPAHRNLKVCVTIPAKNEELLIERALQAFSMQVGVESCAFEVIVLVNHSWDRTLKICNAFVEAHPDLQVYVLVTYSTFIFNVGAARKELMDIAHERLPSCNCLIAMTDADSIVSSQWIANLIKYTNKNVDLICGSLRVNVDGLTPFTCRLFLAKESYLSLRSRLESAILPNPLDPWPGHSYSCGPNMAIKKSAYRAVGGMPALDFLEDIALYDRVVKKGLNIRHCPNVQVESSARLESRTSRGFGDELKYWTSQKDDFKYTVEGLHKLRERLLAFKMIFAIYEENKIEYFGLVSDKFLLPISILKRLYAANTNPKAMNRMLVRILEEHDPWKKTHPNIDVFTAVDELEQFFYVDEIGEVFSQRTSS